MSKDLVDKILKGYTQDVILYKAFLDYLKELKTELQSKEEFKNKNPNVLESLIRIDKSEGMLFTYRIKILNTIKDFDIREMYSRGIIKKVDDIIEENIKGIVETYIKTFFL